MTPQELKNSILQLAIQGKLVEQRPEEGTAEELYQQLIHEKEVGIKKGHWGKSKSLSEIKEDDILFEIPDSWRWIKIGEIAAVVTKGTTPRGGNVSYTDKGIGFLRAENVAGFDKLDKTNLKYIDSETHNGFLKRSILQSDDILITIAGTLGRTALVREQDLPLNANQAVSVVRLVNPHGTDLLYLVYALNSFAIQKYLTEQKKITAIPNLTLEIIENCLIPLPPLAEQQRIVAKIEELLPLIDQYEKAWSRLEEFNKQFPGNLQKSILQMAIQGKLVEQRPEEGTGEELYRQIQAEKKKLIAEGKIKKEKPLPEITEEEEPFDIPDNWKMVRLGDILKEVIVPMRDKPPFSKEGIPWCRIEDRDGYLLNGSKSDQLVSADTIKQMNLKVLPIGTVLSACTGGSIGTIVINTVECCTNQTFNGLVCSTGLYNWYLFWYLTSKFTELRKVGTGTTIAYVSQNKSKMMIIPLPPLAEQKRIVARLEELLPLCEALKS